MKDTVAINKIKKKTDTFNDFKFLCLPFTTSHKSFKFQSPLAALISSSLTIKNNHNLFIIHVFKLSNRWVGIHNDDHLLISLKHALNKNHKITYFKFLKLSMLFFINHNFDFFFVNLKIMFIQARSRPISKLITSLVLLLFFFKEKTKTDR